MSVEPAELYRVQDVQGRGPWRLGFSQRWVSPFSEQVMLPPVWEEDPHFFEIVGRAQRRGLHIGCGVRGLDGIARWFLPDELRTLRTLGFRLVSCDDCEVLLETPHQIVIGSPKPLSCLRRVPWKAISLREAA